MLGVFPSSHRSPNIVMLLRPNLDGYFGANDFPQSCLADNGSSCTSASFAERLQRFEQTVRFAGAGAHHHNGKAERAIQTVMSIARTMMLHAGVHWGEVADLALWPMAVQHAVYVYNCV